MSLRKTTDSRSVSSPTTVAKCRETIGRRSKRNDRELASCIAPAPRELAARETDGIQVVLLWHPAENTLSVSVEDARAGHAFQLAVAPDRALDAFYHPFAYAA